MCIRDRGYIEQQEVDATEFDDIYYGTEEIPVDNTANSNRDFQVRPCLEFRSNAGRRIVVECLEHSGTQGTQPNTLGVRFEPGPGETKFYFDFTGRAVTIEEINIVPGDKFTVLTDHKHFG